MCISSLAGFVDWITFHYEIPYLRFKFPSSLQHPLPFLVGIVLLLLVVIGGVSGGVQQFENLFCIVVLFYRRLVCCSFKKNDITRRHVYHPFFWSGFEHFPPVFVTFRFLFVLIKCFPLNKKILNRFRFLWSFFSADFWRTGRRRNGKYGSKNGSKITPQATTVHRKKDHYTITHTHAHTYRRGTCKMSHHRFPASSLF